MNNFRSRKQGISNIVTTLIIVLLAIAAVAIIWVVLGGLINNSSEKIDVQSKCLTSSVKITQASCEGSVCNITLSRETGDNEFGGVELVIENADQTATSDAYDYNSNIVKLQLQTISFDTGLGDPSVVKAQIYYFNTNGEKQSCEAVSSYTIN